jgi:hypothetical protein
MNAKLEKEKEGNKWFLHFEEEQEVLLKGLLFSRLLGGDGGSVHRNYKTLGFYAKNVVNLREKILGSGSGSGSGNSLNYNDFLRISECIGVQLFYLEKIGWTFYGLCLDEILVIDDCLFIFIGTSFLKKISEDGNISFTAPFKKVENGKSGKLFLSSEVIAIRELPGFINYKSVYSSLGKLLLYLVELGVEEGNGIESIRDTKLYWFIQRSIHDKILLLV